MMPKSRMASSKEPLYVDVDDVYQPTIVRNGRHSERWITFMRYFSVASIFVLCCLILFHIFYPDEHGGRTLEEVHWNEHRFVTYGKKFGKEYDGTEETVRAFTAYEKHMRDVETYNDEYPDVEFGETGLSDYTDEEFRKTLLPLDFYKKLREKATFIQKNPPTLERTAPYPDHFDWRAQNVVTPVKAQGKCGSCWAFAATATVEAAWKIAHPKDERILSEQTLLDCDMTNDACNGGDEDKAFRFIHRQGLAYLTDYPYVAHRQNSCLADSFHNRTKIEIAYFINPDEHSMIDWLVNFGPVNIGMSVIQPMRAYKGGVFHPSVEACKTEVIGLHAMLVVGYGTSEKGEKYWIIKNSWGQDWGVESGYIYYARGFNACFVEDEPVGILAGDAQ